MCGRYTLTKTELLEEFFEFSFTGNQINFNPEWDPSVTLSFTFTRDGKGNLHLTPVQPMDNCDWLECGYRPWIKIG